MGIGLSTECLRSEVGLGGVLRQRRQNCLFVLAEIRCKNWRSGSNGHASGREKHSKGRDEDSTPREIGEATWQQRGLRQWSPEMISDSRCNSQWERARGGEVQVAGWPSGGRDTRHCRARRRRRRDAQQPTISHRGLGGAPNVAHSRRAAPKAIWSSARDLWLARSCVLSRASHSDRRVRE